MSKRASQEHRARSFANTEQKMKVKICSDRTDNDRTENEGEDTLIEKKHYLFFYQSVSTTIKD